MKIRELFDKKTVFSFEVFPPKKTSSIDTVYKTLEELEGVLDPELYIGRSPEQVDNFLREISHLIVNTEQNNADISL